MAVARGLNVQIAEAPALRPSVEEFADPISYISKITADYAQYGIVKIIPPACWQPHFVCDVQRFEFQPRLQRLYELNALLRVRNNFISALSKFYSLQGFTLKIPSINGRELNLHDLYKEVVNRGGYEQCSRLELWSHVATALGFASSEWTRLKTNYRNLLLAYELHMTKVNESSLPLDKTNSQNGAIAKQMDGGPKAKRFKAAQECDVANIFCEVCARGDSEELLLLCDSCDVAIHTHCLVPPLKKVPSGDWHCPRCVIEECRKPLSPFGFVNDVKTFTFESFEQFADDFKRNYFHCDPKQVSCDDVEQKFWQIVADPASAVTVRYGSDISTLDVGSGFPSRSCAGLSPKQKACALSPWNLKNMPSLPSSALSFIDGQVSGVNVPWLYVGMCFSTFCWHTEDHWCYSISYLHLGDVKTWYGVPGTDAENFEQVIKGLTPELFDWQPDVMHHLVTLVDPQILVQKGVPVYKLHQEPGEFVITFPRSYHAGFNNGFNCAEAVNVCPAEWLPFGRRCIESYAIDHRLCVFSHEELLCKMGLSSDLALSLISAVYEDLNEIIGSEAQRRSTLGFSGSTELTIFENIPDDERQCSVCCTTLFLSCLACSCSPPKLVCLRDIARLPCSCHLGDCTFRYRYTSQELQDLLRCFEARFQAQLQLPKSPAKISIMASTVDKGQL
uniref:[histone H3]-trimethyl-L-lysine(4) demethylase n=1 Tax=Trichuris muris TaxID=70415 RepID=A0A5S6R4T4_TRIMR